MPVHCGSDRVASLPLDTEGRYRVTPVLCAATATQQAYCPIAHRSARMCTPRTPHRAPSAARVPAARPPVVRGHGRRALSTRGDRPPPEEYLAIHRAAASARFGLTPAQTSQANIQLDATWD